MTRGGAALLALALSVAAFCALVLWTARPVPVAETLDAAFDAELKSMREMALTNGDKPLLTCAETLQAERAAGRLQSLPVKPMPKACDEAARAAMEALARALGKMLRGAPTGPPISLPPRRNEISCLSGCHTQTLGAARC